MKIIFSIFYYIVSILFVSAFAYTIEAEMYLKVLSTLFICFYLYLSYLYLHKLLYKEEVKFSKNVNSIIYFLYLIIAIAYNIALMFILKYPTFMNIMLVLITICITIITIIYLRNKWKGDNNEE